MEGEEPYLHADLERAVLQLSVRLFVSVEHSLLLTTEDKGREGSAASGVNLQSLLASNLELDIPWIVQHLCRFN